MQSVLILHEIHCVIVFDLLPFLNAAEIRRQKKHAEVLLTIPRRGAGNDTIDVALSEAREKLRKYPGAAAGALPMALSGKPIPRFPSLLVLQRAVSAR